MQGQARHQKGIGLLEVLVAAAVFALGVMAVVKLQGEFLKGGSEADARAIAVQLAQQKLDDLRRFGTSGANSFAFTDIANDAGGTIASDASTSNGVNAIGNTDYSLGWAVTDYYFSGTPASQTPTTTPSGNVAQKRITITVGWTDQAGNAQSVQLSDILNSMAPTTAAGLSGGASSGSATTGPQVTYTPSASADVVAVSVGTGTSRETLVPTVTGNEVKFTAYTYNASGKLLRQEDFATVGCTCTKSATQGSGRTPAHAVWDTSGKTFKDLDGDVVTKDVGTKANNQQDDLCDACCRDHHDPGSGITDVVSSNPTTADPLTSGGGDDTADGQVYCDPASGVYDRCYDPFRDAGGVDDFSSGKHIHYTSAGAAVAAGGDYVESCRMKRVDGYWRVYQDWHRVDLQAFLLTNAAGTTMFTGATKSDYASYVQAIVDGILDNGAISKFYGQSLTLPTAPSAKLTSSNPLSLAVNDTVQMTGRAIYVDYLSNSLLTQVRQKKSGGEDYLVDVPFYEVDVTERSPTCSESPISTQDSTYPGGWCRPTGTSSMTVGAVGSGANALNAGQIKGVSDSGGQKTVIFDFRRSNSGLTGSSSPADVNSSATNRDRYKDRASIVTVVTGSGATTVNLSVSLTGGSPTSSLLSYTDASGTVQCTGVNTGPFTCPVHSGVAGTLTYSGSNATQTCTGSGSYSAITANATLSPNLTITCTATAVNYPLTVTFTYSPNNKKADAVTSVTAVSSAGANILVGSCTPSTQGSAITGLTCHVSASSGTVTFDGTRTQGGSTYACTGAGTFSGATQSGGTAAITVTCQ